MPQYVAWRRKREKKEKGIDSFYIGRYYIYSEVEKKIGTQSGDGACGKYRLAPTAAGTTALWPDGTPSIPAERTR
jgi:hypothetical protein